jgi:N-acetylmuramoyl-L-alanine amidase
MEYKASHITIIKYVAFITVLLLCIFTPFAAAEAEIGASTSATVISTPTDFNNYKQGTVNASSLNLRQGAGTSYGSVAKLPQGTSVAIYDASGSWYKVFAVSYGWGWVSSEYIKLKNVQISSVSSVVPDDNNDNPAAGGGIAGKLIYLDPGHGNYSDNGYLDIGASAYGLDEKDVNYAVAVKARDLLINLGADVILTRTDVPETMTLYDRAGMANDAGADVFVSIHANAFTDPYANGTSTWFYAPVGNSFYDRDARLLLANLIQENLVTATGLSNYGVREANFAVTRETYMPAVLIETAFITNPSDNTYLASESGQAALAQGIVNGLVAYFGQ